MALMPRFPWRIFWVLLAAAFCGALAILPYLRQALANTPALENAPKGTGLFIATQLLNLSLMFGIAIGFGLFLAAKVDLRLPVLSRCLYGTRTFAPAGSLHRSLVSGLLIGAGTVLLLYLVVLPRLANFPTEAAIPFWKRFLACFYGGINEELLIRLFLLSVVLWLLEKLCRRTARASAAVFWIGNLLVALLFGAAYLPAVAAFIPLTPFVIISIVALKGGAGLIFGQLCWARGLEAAILAHFVSDLVIHLVGPLLAVR